MQLKIQIAKTVQNRKPICWKRRGGAWVSHVPYRKKWNWSRYVDERPHRYHRQLMSVFVSAGLISAPGTPCFERKNLDLTSLPKENETWAWDENEYMRWEPKKYIYINETFTKVEVLHLFRCSTHTPSRRRVWNKVLTMKWKWKGKEMKMR